MVKVMDSILGGLELDLLGLVHLAECEACDEVRECFKEGEDYLDSIIADLVGFVEALREKAGMEKDIGTN